MKNKYGLITTTDNRTFSQEYLDSGGEDQTARVVVEVGEEDGVYLESRTTDASIAESLSIPTTDLAIAVARYILERSSVSVPDAKSLALEYLDELENSVLPTARFTISEVKMLVSKH